MEEWKIRKWSKCYEEVGGQLQEWGFYCFEGSVQHIMRKEGFLLNRTDEFKLLILFQVVQSQQNQWYYRECWSKQIMLILTVFDVDCQKKKRQKILQTGAVTSFNSPHNAIKKCGSEVFLANYLFLYWKIYMHDILSWKDNTILACWWLTNRRMNVTVR